MLNFQDSGGSRAIQMCVMWRLVTRQAIYKLSCKTKQEKGKGDDQKEKKSGRNKKIKTSQRSWVWGIKKEMRRADRFCFSFTLKLWIYTCLTGNMIRPSSLYQQQLKVNGKPHRWKRLISSPKSTILIVKLNQLFMNQTPYKYIVILLSINFEGKKKQPPYLLIIYSGVLFVCTSLARVLKI